MRAPAAYAKATWWRLCGKRVRARGQLSPLLGASPLAYRLWLCRQEAAVSVERAPAAARTPLAPPITAVVDTAGGSEGLEATLQSLAVEGIPAVIVGDIQSPHIPVVNSLADAAANIDWRGEPWLLPMVTGDILACGAAQAYLAALAGSAARVAYADDDLIDPRGNRHSPHFKPDWNSELFRHHDYLSGAAIVRVEQSQLAALSGTADWLRNWIELVSADGTPVHVRQILHHRRNRPQPRVPVRPGAVEGNRPLVSVIIPTRDRANLLRTCLEGLSATNYPDLDVIIVDNGSTDPQALTFLDSLNAGRFRVMRHEGAFNFAAINNRAAQQARGEVLCLLNNDIEVLEPGWLSIMVQQAMRDDVGAVGAQLLYPDGRIQHAGVILGIGGAAAHAHRLLMPEEEGYFRRHQLPQHISAVTAACLVVRRDRFMAVGGFDEHNFAVAFNDVDLCLRLNQRGWQTFYEPRARLVHHESVSRGFDRDPAGARRFAGELNALKRKWGTDAMADPQHHPAFSRYSERFVVAL